LRKIRRQRFETEARVIAALNHPNILSIHDIGTYEGAPYLVSECLEGQTLRMEMRDSALPVRQVVDYGIQIAHGPSDAAGVTTILNVRMTADGKTCAYSFSRELSDLFLVEGVR
jgi:serine/threonine protein kinase